MQLWPQKITPSFTQLVATEEQGTSTSLNAPKPSQTAPGQKFPLNFNMVATG